LLLLPVLKAFLLLLFLPIEFEVRSFRIILFGFSRLTDFLIRLLLEGIWGGLASGVGFWLI
jgi:hypothetical protein